MLWLLISGKSILALSLFAILFGLTYSSLDILLTLLSSSSFGLIALGTIIGFINAMLQLGGAFGPFVAGLIFDSRGNYHLAFAICVLVSTLSVIITFLRRPNPNSTSLPEK